MAVGFGLNIMITLLVLFATLGAVVWLFQDEAFDTLDVMREALMY